ncbi:MAG: NAD-dependent epimerase/dehydratase family protein [Cyclobacteriaceae bacterium]|tara:strand:- start:2990 stop:4015 length:1026 start_codon:yes stop_codon:yes gene_type:complete
MKILITGCAGFIGMHLSLKLCAENFEVIGIDNLAPNYDINLKISRLINLGVDMNSNSKDNKRYSEKGICFIETDLRDDKIFSIFNEYKFDYVIHLAGLGGVRNSLINPKDYIGNNINAFGNILEACAKNNVKHLLFASSSSVYGENPGNPSREDDDTNCPLSLYAASKKANESMAYSYFHNYDLDCIGLRFFTVYGPWCRPDMGMSIFTKKIISKEPIDLFNFGNLTRDFTYVQDIVDGINSIIEKISFQTNPNYDIVNIGFGENIEIQDIIISLERELGMKTTINKIENQKGDVYNTLCNNEKLKTVYDYQPKIDIGVGIPRFVKWYKEYYQTLLLEKAY